MTTIPQKMHVSDVASWIADTAAPDAPVLIAGATASGKSGLALDIAEKAGGVIVNADALQVYDCWSVLTACPDASDLAQADHKLYRHVPYDADYSVGAWLRDVAPLLRGAARPIIVGGTGLNFRALTEGLADIPPVPADVRKSVLDQMQDKGLAFAVDQLADADKEYIDTKNPARVSRAWEVYAATGVSLHEWHARTPAPLVDLENAIPLHLDGEVDWLNARIEQRFDIMLDAGALNEVEANLTHWNDTLPAFQAIGGPELRRYLLGEIDLKTARDLAITASRQYAKRQRTWFRKRMKSWYKVGI